ETAPNGSGSVIPDQNLTAGSSITGYGINRDQAGNFVGNVGVTWALTDLTGRVISSDLVASADLKSAVFTGHATGKARLSATDGGWNGNTGIVTVKAGGPRKIRVESAATGSGSVVSNQSVPANSSVTVFAVQRDDWDNYVENVPVVYSLTDVTGGVVPGDLVPSVDSRSAVFTGHSAGTARVTVTAGGAAGAVGRGGGSVCAAQRAA